MYGITILSATLTRQWVVGFFADKIIVPEEHCENITMSGLSVSFLLIL